MRDSVITRLLLLALVLVSVGSALRHYAVPEFLRKDLSIVVEGQQLALANYVARDIDGKILQRQALLESLAASLPLDALGKPGRLRDWLKERYNYQALFSAGLFVVDARGVAIADYPVLPGRENADYSDRDYIRVGLEGRSNVGRPIIGRAAREPVLPLAVPIRNGRNEVVGVLAGITALAAPGFLEALQQTRIGGKTGGFLLVSPQDELFVASSQADMVLKRTPPTGVNALHDKAMAGFRGSGVTVNAQGVEEVSAIASVPSTGWFVVARLPGSEAFATVERTKAFLLRGSMLTLLVFVLLVPLGLWLVFKPLFRAAERADRMTQGELPLEPLPVVRNDEVGHLISAFNRLLAKLNVNQAELARIAHHDELTGLPNRALLYDRLQQALARARRRNAELALLFMDLDGFKEVNDSFGHKAGDDMLRQVALRFASVIREADTLARVGGDEFVLLIGDLEGHAENVAGIVANKCIAALRAPIRVAGQECTVGVSIGIALGRGQTPVDALLQAADQAMYEAKKAGRGCYVTRRL